MTGTTPSPAPAPFSCILWDVDGTLVDASEGILRRLQHTLVGFDRELTAAELPRWIGPPLIDSFQVRAGLSPHEAAQALARYRERAVIEGYAAGARLYDGVLPVVQAVHAAGIPQATASSKPQDQVSLLMSHFEVDPYLTAVVGSGVVETKAAVVQDALAQLAAAGADLSRPVLIGDRLHDVEGAAQVGIESIFVGWGFGDPSEARGALATIDHPHHLLDVLL